MPLTCAIGDVHGMLPKLRDLIARGERYAAGRPMTYVLLGDYIDRGPESAGVVGLLIDLQASRPDGVVALKGNHEAMMLGVIDGTEPEEQWLSQGGTATLRSYGVNSAHNLPTAHIDWLRALPLSHDDGRCFFVHAGIDPERPLSKQRAQDLLWIRQPFLSDRRDHGRLIVHGHTPVPTKLPDLQTNRLNLDTGAVFGGPLTAAIFADLSVKPAALISAP